MEDPSAREEPRAVNQYLLGDVIGEGQFGKVLQHQWQWWCWRGNPLGSQVREAMNSKTAKRVAIKKLSMERVKKARAIGMVRRSTEDWLASAVHEDWAMLQVKQEVAVIKLLQKHAHKHVVKFFEVIEQRDNHNKVLPATVVQSKSTPLACAGTGVFHHGTGQGWHAAESHGQCSRAQSASGSSPQLLQAFDARIGPHP